MVLILGFALRPPDYESGAVVFFAICACMYDNMHLDLVHRRCYQLSRKRRDFMIVLDLVCGKMLLISYSAICMQSTTEGRDQKYPN